MRLFDRIKKLDFTYSDFLFPFVAGLVAHGYEMFSKYPNRDEFFAMFHYGNGYPLGRWMLSMMGNLLFRIDGCYSTPWLNGLISLAFLCLTVLLFLEPFEIGNKSTKNLLAALFVVFPSVTATLTYMFTAPFYAFSMFLCAIAFWIAVRTKYGFLCGALLVCMSLGIYQGYFAVLAGFAFFFFYFMLLKGIEFKNAIVMGLKQIAMMVVGLVLYMVATKVIMAFRGEEVSGYQNISSMGQYSLGEIVFALKSCYKDFFLCFTSDGYAMFPFRIFNVLIVGLWVLFLVSLAVLLAGLIKTALVNSVAVILLTLLIPIPVSLINVICAGSIESIHMLMRTGIYFMIAVPFLTLSCISGEKEYVKTFVPPVLLAMAAVLILFFVRYSNMVYLSYDLRYEQTYSAFQSVLNGIRNADGYDDSLPLAFTGSYPDPAPMWEMRYADKTTGMYTPGYVMNEATMRANFFKFFMGYSYQEVVLGDDLLTSEEYSNMPAFPDKGSVRVIDGIVVIKFREME